MSSSRVSMLLTVYTGEEVKVSLKKGEFFVGVLTHRMTHKVNDKVTSVSHYQLKNFQLTYVIDDDLTVVKNTLELEPKNIENVELYSDVEGEYHSDLSKIQKQCFWPVDLEKKVNKSGQKKFLKAMEQEEQRFWQVNEAIEKGFASSLAIFSKNTHLIQKDENGKFLLKAIEHNRAKMVKWFFESDNYTVPENKNRRAKLFYEASRRGNLDIIQLLVKNGFDINTSYFLDLDKKDYEYVPIEPIVNEAHREVLTWLIEKKLITITPRKFFGLIKQNYSNVLFDLLLALIPKSEKQIYYNNGLAAAPCGGFDLIDKFIQLGADINFIDEQGCTALCYALLNYSDYSLKTLVKAGANISLGDMGGGQSPIQFAESEEFGRAKYVEILNAQSVSSE
ncbi:MAG: hypothetical protein JKY54_15210 [Flavobacteriales bacterium]|nr:hypothetical protein [Flavobacteriales bacterium]